jgi:hypothetical protein
MLREREFREGPLDRDNLSPQMLQRFFGALLRHLLQLFHGQSTLSSRHRHPFRQMIMKRGEIILKGLKAVDS